MSVSYERMNYITSFGFSIRWRRQFINEFQPTQNKVEVLDLLTGMGETWGIVRKKFPNANITALDFSDGMLRYAGEKNKARFESKIKITQQDVLNNQLPSGHYDYVTCAFGLKTFNKEQLQLLAVETKRVLKPGGQFSFVEVSKPRNSFMQMLYGFYLGRVVPKLADRPEYKMLWNYTKQFSDAGPVADIFREAGLEVDFRSFFYGCATGFIGRRSH